MPTRANTSPSARWPRWAAAMKQVKGQRYAHPRLGNYRATLIDAATLRLPCTGYPRVLNALKAIDEAAAA